MAASERIVISGAREHNLKDIDVELPRDALIVITGLSGSGKSSLAFDTIYAEGQRRYVESLSAYARQFLGLMEKPDVDSIEGLSPAISIDQKTTSRNPRSTVGTVTEIYDYLRLLWARIGVPHCPECGEEITGQTQEQIVDRLMTLEEGTKFMVMAPVVRGRKGEYGKLLEQMRLEGYSRVKVNGELRRLDEEIVLDKKFKHDISVVVDRLVMKPDLRRRLSESVEAAAGARRRPGRSRDRRASEGRAAALLRAVRLPQLRHLDPRAGAADLLLQLAPRRLRALPRARLPAGDRPRAGRPRPDPLARRGRPAALEPRHHRLLEAADRRRRRGVRGRRRQALVEAEEEPRRRSSSTAPARSATRSPTPTASAAAAPTRSASRGSSTTSQRRYEETDSETNRERIEGYMAEQPCPRLRRRPAAAGEPRGQGRRDQHRRVQRPLGAGGGASGSRRWR